MIYCQTLLRVGLGPINIELLFYLVKQWFLCSIIGCAETLRAFEHDMLQIVSETGIVRRIVLTSVTDCDVSLKSGLFLIYGHINLKSVVEGINLDLHRVSLDCLILGT